MNEESEGETVPTLELAELETQPLAEAKEWEVNATDLGANHLNLSAGRYKPFSLKEVHHDPPAQIIGELQELEARIQAGLAELLATVEGGE